MSTPDELSDHLAQQLGESLDRAFREDLQTSRRPLRRLRALRRTRRMAIGVLAAGVLVPAAAIAATIAATRLITPGQVATGLSHGTLALLGTNPTCTVITTNQEFRCVLASEPKQDFIRYRDTAAQMNRVIMAARKAAAANTSHTRVQVIFFYKNEHKTIIDTNGLQVIIEPDTSHASATNWLGAIADTTDSTSHVNGACRSLNHNGTTWNCYIGDAAVHQGLISQDLLGRYAPKPGVE